MASSSLSCCVCLCRCSTYQAMWFQGRDEEIEDEVVSLSTGRIYKASSPDGLKWTLEEGPPWMRKGSGATTTRTST